jgi:phosphoglycolate phosphatase
MGGGGKLRAEKKQFPGVRGLIFDLDGTLIDSKLDLALAVNAALEQMGHAPLEHEQVYNYVGQGAPLLIRRALGAGTTDEEAQRGLDIFLRYYREHMLDNTVAYPGVREALEQLNGWPMAVLTNKPVRFSREILEGLAMTRYFGYVYGGNSFERKKPDPMGVEVLLKDWGIGAREAMMVGDSEVDVQTARNAGTWACGVSYGLGSARLAEFPPDILLDSLADLPACLDHHAAG